MSDPMQVALGERRVVRVFQLDMPAQQVKFLRDEPGAVADVLGVAEIDMTHVDIIKIADLDDLGLAGYLTDGCDVPPDDIAPDRARLASLQGDVMVVLSRAFAQGGIRLTPSDRLKLFAAYGQQEIDWTAGPLTSDSTRGGRSSPREARHRARRIGAGIFAVFMIAIVLILAAVIW